MTFSQKMLHPHSDGSLGKLLAVIIVGGVAMVLLLTLCVWMCVSRRSVFKVYTRNRVDYMEVDTAEEDSD